MNAFLPPGTRAGTHRGPGAGTRIRERLRAAGTVMVLLVGFVVVPLDELVTAWLGVPPVVPRVRRWGRHVRQEWRIYRERRTEGVVDAEILDGVWR